MKKIQPEIIDDIVLSLNKLKEQEFAELIDELGELQPAIYTYIFSEDFEALGEEEHQLLIVNTVMLWKIIEKSTERTTPPDNDYVDSLQFKNWSVAEALETTRGQTFDDFVEPMIAEYPQDELLYFVLDTFMANDDEEEPMSKESKLPIFIALKTLCDAWLDLKSN